MGVGTFAGVVIVLLLVFSIFAIVIDPSPASIVAKPFHLARNIADWGIEIGWTGVKFGYTIIGNQEGIDSTDRTLEIHRAFYGFRQDQHIDCCRQSECYIEKVCTSYCVDDCKVTENNLKTYYAN